MASRPLGGFVVAVPGRPRETRWRSRGTWRGVPVWRSAAGLRLFERDGPLPKPVPLGNAQHHLQSGSASSSSSSSEVSAETTVCLLRIPRDVVLVELLSIVATRDDDRAFEGLRSVAILLDAGARKKRAPSYSALLTFATPSEACACLDACGDMTLELLESPASLGGADEARRCAALAVDASLYRPPDDAGLESHEESDDRDEEDTDENDDTGADKTGENLSDATAPPPTTSSCASPVVVPSLSVLAARAARVRELPTCPTCVRRLDCVDARLVRWGAATASKGTNAVEKTNADSCACCEKMRRKEDARCASCGDATSLWACLCCGLVGCGRYSKEHAKAHAALSTHALSIDLQTERVWDYARDQYVHRVDGAPPLVFSASDNHHNRGGVFFPTPRRQRSSRSSATVTAVEESRARAASRRAGAFASAEERRRLTLLSSKSGGDDGVALSADAAADHDEDHKKPYDSYSSSGDDSAYQHNGVSSAAATPSQTPRGVAATRGRRVASSSSSSEIIIDDDDDNLGTTKRHGLNNNNNSLVLPRSAAAKRDDVDDRGASSHRSASRGSDALSHQDQVEARAVARQTKLTTLSDHYEAILQAQLAQQREHYEAKLELYRRESARAARGSNGGQNDARDDEALALDAAEADLAALHALVAAARRDLAQTQSRHALYLETFNAARDETLRLRKETDDIKTSLRETLYDLKCQIRDLEFYFKARRRVGADGGDVAVAR